MSIREIYIYDPRINFLVRFIVAVTPPIWRFPSKFYFWILSPTLNDQTNKKKKQKYFVRHSSFVIWCLKLLKMHEKNVLTRKRGPRNVKFQLIHISSCISA